MNAYEVSVKINEIRAYGTIVELSGEGLLGRSDVSESGHDDLVAVCLQRITERETCNLSVDLGVPNTPLCWVSLVKDISGKLQAYPFSKIAWFRKHNN